MLVLNLYFMHLQEGLVPLCNHLYVTKGAILYGAVSDVSALHATKGGVYKTNHE